MHLHLLDRYQLCIRDPEIIIKLLGIAFNVKTSWITAWRKWRSSKNYKYYQYFATFWNLRRMLTKQ